LQKHKNYMYVNYFRNAEAEENGGGSAPAEVTSEQKPVESNAVEAASEEPAEINYDFELDDEEANAESKPNTSVQNAGTSNATASGETVPKADYDKLVAELHESKSALAQFQKLNDDPIIKKTVEYLVGLEQGVEADPQVLHEQIFGINVASLSEEQLLSKVIQMEANELGVKLELSDLENIINERLGELDSMTDPLKRASAIKAMKEKVKSTSGTNVSEEIQKRIADRKQGDAYWQKTGEQLISFLDELVAKGSKDFGNKAAFTKTDKDLILEKVNNGIYRFKGDQLDLKHLVETLSFAKDPNAYIKSIMESAKNKAKVQSLAERSAGSLVNNSDPANIAQRATFTRDLSNAKMDDFDPRKAITVN
jgi:hypothetical protein